MAGLFNCRPMGQFQPANQLGPKYHNFTLCTIFSSRNCKNRWILKWSIVDERTICNDLCKPYQLCNSTPLLLQVFVRSYNETVLTTKVAIVLSTLILSLLGHGNCCAECISIAKEYIVQRLVKTKSPIIKEIICCVWMHAEQKNNIWTGNYDHRCILFSCICSAHERATAALVWVTWILGKKKRVFTDGEMVKYMLSTVEEAVTINWGTRWCHA